jgi:D-threo-aldose 1-dehydrogenase
MKRNRIGGTAVEVTEIAFGCSGLGNLYREVDEGAARAILQLAWDRGIRYFDTAPHYGRGLSETRVGAFFAGRDRSSYALSTKVGRLLSPGPQLAEADGFVNPLPMRVRYDYSGDGLEASFEQSCERLRTRFVDIVYVHDIGEATHGAANAEHFADLMGTGLDRLRRLKAAGRIGAFGLGVNERQVCLDVLAEAEIDVILLAGRLTLLDRSAEERLVPLCRQRGVSLVLGGVFNSGILATGPVPGAHYDYGPAPAEVLAQVAALERRAEAAGVTLAAAALRFALSRPEAAATLINTTRPQSLNRHCDAAEAPWPAAAAALFGPPPAIGSEPGSLYCSDS